MRGEPYEGRRRSVCDVRRSRKNSIRPASPIATNVRDATGRRPALREAIWVAYERNDISDQRDWADSADQAEAAEPSEPIDATDPTLPIDPTDPTEPNESTDRCDPMDRTESVDHRDQRLVMKAS